MAFAGINWLAVLLAAAAAWITGAVWYATLAKPWAAAQGRTMEEIKAAGTPVVPYAITFGCELVMAFVLAGSVGHLGPGQVTLRNSLISAFFLWVGFVLPTVAVNNMFGARRPMLTAIDAGHWLAVLLVMGAVIGAMGVR